MEIEAEAGPPDGMQQELVENSALDQDPSLLVTDAAPLRSSDLILVEVDLFFLRGLPHEKDLNCGPSNDREQDL